MIKIKHVEENITYSPIRICFDYPVSGPIYDGTKKGTYYPLENRLFVSSYALSGEYISTVEAEPSKVQKALRDLIENTYHVSLEDFCKMLMYSEHMETAKHVNLDVVFPD